MEDDLYERESMRKLAKNSLSTLYALCSGEYLPREGDLCQPAG
jgi:hypothetical protein